MASLAGKTIFLTGGSRGIGEAIAKLFAEQGAHVIVSSRRIEGCQKVVDEITAAGGSAEAFPCHIGDMAQIADIFDMCGSYLRLGSSKCIEKL